MKKILKLPIYECVITMYILPDIKSVSDKYKYLKKKYPIIKDDIEDAYGVTLNMFDNYILLISKSGNYINTFFHELSHLIENICKDRGIEDFEAKAYLQGMIGEHFLKFFL